MSTLTDDDLTRLLDEAGQATPVPDDGIQAVLVALEDVPAPVSLRRRRPVQLVAAAAVVCAAFLGGALLQGGGGASERATTALSSAPTEEALSGLESPAAPDQAAPQDSESSNLDATQDFAGAGAARQSGALSGESPAASAPVPAPAPGQPADETAAAPGVQAPAPDGARIVKNGSIALIVGDGRVTPTLTAVQQLATSAGGLVQSAQTQESGRTPSGSVVLRVPVANFEDVVTRVRSLDAEVRSATTTGRDVTAEYTDVESQLRTLRAARERFLTILAGATSIPDVLTVQQRVDDTTGQIDQLEGQRALLEDQSDTATLEVTVTQADDPVVAATEEPDDGLGKAFRDGWEGFTSGVEALVAASGRALVVLLCAAVVVVGLRLGWRASRRRLV